MSDTKNAVAAMKAMRFDLERGLMSNPDFRKLRALEDAIRAIEDPSADDHAIARPEAIRNHGDAAYQVLLQSGQPMPTNEILEAVQRMGIRIGGANPATNFSSALSRDNRFKSIHWNNSRRWWITDRNPPPDPGREVFHNGRGQQQ